LLGWGFSENFSSGKGNGRRAIVGIEAIHDVTTVLPELKVEHRRL
jgi:hypothetical protein